MSRKTTFSSTQLPPHLNERDRFSLWQDIHVAEIWSVEYGISGNLPFEATIEAEAIGPIVLGQMSGTIKHATRKASNIADDDNDGYLLLINKADTVLAGTQVGRDYGVGQGEAALVTAAEPLKMIGSDKNVWMNVVIPRAILTHAFPRIDVRNPGSAVIHRIDVLTQFDLSVGSLPGPECKAPSIDNQNSRTTIVAGPAGHPCPWNAPERDLGAWRRGQHTGSCRAENLIALECLQSARILREFAPCRSA
ncbi:hypothetical protein [Mesorhizobium kowhaii]|uniref:hypothetical protein n=1 Tax=Mesorhizobium kowhaii TaxID=1300272 RepID=UPI001FDEF497|nr:hypothetical protein [Mesorhizobium kowhaii]